MAKRGGFPGGAMPGNMNNLMKQAQRMQRQMEEGQKELETKEFTATAGGGAVEVTVSGKKEVVSVKLLEEVVDPDDIEMLQDFIDRVECVGVESLANSCVVLRIIADVNEENIFKGKRVLNRELKIAFDKAGISIPYPQLDVHNK